MEPAAVTPTPEVAREPLTAGRAVPRPGFALAVGTLWQREVVRFLRQRNRVIGALATPIVFWLLLGFGLNDTFLIRPPEGSPEVAAAGLGYLEYFFPGALVMILLFTSIFSTITVIEDRREGFLQGVLVSPASRLAIVLGKTLGGATLATLQAIVFLAIWPFVGAFPGWGAVVACLVVAFVVSGGLTALGLSLAWPMRSTAGFHAVMNLLLMPMWFLSGAVFPLATAPLGLQLVMYLNPLTYGHALLAATLLGADTARAVSGVPIPLAAAVSLAFAGVATAAAARVAGRPREDGV